MADQARRPDPEAADDRPTYGRPANDTVPAEWAEWEKEDGMTPEERRAFHEELAAAYDASLDEANLVDAEPI